jgi:hypothetical protein
MLKQIGLIAIVAMGITLLIPGTHVEAKSSHHQSNLHKTGRIGLGIVTIIKLKKHREKPTQIFIGKPLNPSYENPPYENPPYENPPYENPPYENPPYENPPYENPP